MKGIIDIGSNSVRLLVNGKKTVVVTRLAQNMKGGVLDEEAMERTVAAVKELCDRSGCECVAFATEAVRKAVNKAEFLGRIYERCKIMPEVLSGEEEAEIGFIGATANYSGKATVIDLGGASCEIVFGENGMIRFARSFPFGCVTMTDKFGSDYAGIERFVKEQLGGLPHSDGTAIAVGGTVTSLAAMAQELPAYDPSKVDGFKLDIGAIRRIISDFLGGKEFPSLESKRRATIIQGASVIIAVLGALALPSLIVSESDNLEGYKAVKKL